ncbi:MAG: FmdB family transcriptional regulator [Actinobacteria bacterium]|nr:FmdB family transcriptional regulator [Actinomycetota bacterium]MCG2818543.1 FmdB family transcriptional regulator [Actinomycetes bacterium]MBU4179174.1 FmdB family transcriptional regulator [Actinomycetota bacterium]MBU4218268.1 FmdB family transcriptional regulator [Actinomycetota bacterium]MBU4358693.1 FmdB family transcriptional regulator [Actinomycetota bacterium]
MPRYEYKCKDCGKTFEVVHGINDNVESCQFCGSEVRRLFHPVGIVFKGSGFYSTDSKSASKEHHVPSTEDTKESAGKSGENGGKDKKKEKDKKAGDSVKATS